MNADSSPASQNWISVGVKFFLSCLMSSLPESKIFYLQIKGLKERMENILCLPLSSSGPLFSSWTEYTSVLYLSKPLYEYGSSIMIYTQSQCSVWFYNMLHAAMIHCCSGTERRWKWVRALFWSWRCNYRCGEVAFSCSALSAILSSESGWCFGKCFNKINMKNHIFNAPLQ